jgi:ferredoxin-NADP reductase
MADYVSRLKSREEVAEGTMAFHFEKPGGFQFKPGQSVDITLIDPPETDSEGNTRTFSVASAPHEDELLVATRMRDTAFKRVLRTSPSNTKVKIDGPMGSFTLHNNPSKPAIFLAGGIGITPFSSILRHAATSKLAHQLYLFYSNRRPEDAAFLKVLQQLEKANSNFRFIPTMTEMAKSQREWNGEVGYINREMLMKYVADLRGPIYYVAGPPTFVTALRQTLTAAGVDEDDLRTEEFAGY